MRHISLPSFFCPFQSQINENVEAVHRYTLQWAVDTGLVVQGDRRYQRLEQARFAWLTSLTQPYSQLEDLKLAADWHTWLFAHDDVVDATAVGCNPREVEAIHGRLVEVLHGAELRQNDGGMAHALENIRQRIFNRTNRTWTERFTADVEQYFQGNQWEVANRYENVTPDLATYIKIRQFSGAVFTCFDIIYLSLDLAPNARFLQHAYIQQLAMMANHHICWVNDIMGLQKEIRENNMSNLVLVLQKMHTITLGEAVEMAISYCNWEMEAFIKLTERLPAFDFAEQAQLAAYLNTLQAWMCGHIQWYRETGRYEILV